MPTHFTPLRINQKREYREKRFSKTKRLAAEEKQYQMDKAEQEHGIIDNMETVNPLEIASVAESEFQ